MNIFASIEMKIDENWWNPGIFSIVLPFPDDTAVKMIHP